MPAELLPCTVRCRFHDCIYTASGSRDFVEVNYRVHLREDHKIKCPKVEVEEFR